MARITVEECLAQIPNRFDLTLTAAYRARQLANGAAHLVDNSKDKPTSTILYLLFTRGLTGLWSSACFISIVDFSSHSNLLKNNIRPVSDLCNPLHQKRIGQET